MMSNNSRLLLLMAVAGITGLISANAFATGLSHKYFGYKQKNSCYGDCPDKKSCPAGPQGPKGDPGPQGPAGPTLTRHVVTKPCDIRELNAGAASLGSKIECTAACPTGTIVMGGGCSLDIPKSSLADNTGYALTSTQPLTGSTGEAWQCSATVADDVAAKSLDSGTLTSKAICAGGSGNNNPPSGTPPTGTPPNGTPPTDLPPG
jgi:hypothetical protein